ncbi:hypothetical protein OF897_08960 [Chryseobacterium formosus]|uniref:Uncharacterized protein n=1 Tax=Chryseobacterium formosus TaxID=1537363 RepID=A0ABT3XRS6_9FLAO|nr:hypothetical protein [Chryseobacterium formosus]MCX8524053.1 hypothetical protein [Chryseobacterium formosus]
MTNIEASFLRGFLMEFNDESFCKVSIGSNENISDKNHKNLNIILRNKKINLYIASR